MDEKLKLAMRAVTKDNSSLKAAAKQFGIARTTLKRHLSNPNVKASGRPRFFTDSEEQLLHQILRNIQVLQQPFSRPKFIEVARKLAERKAPGQPGRTFGKEWLSKFIRRHPDLALRSKSWKAEQRQWTPDKCERYVQVLEYLDKEGFLMDSRAIFVLDSLELITPPNEYTKSGNLIARKPSEEQGFPVFVCGSADGTALRPMILRDGNFILEPWFTDLQEEAVVVGHAAPDIAALDVDALALYLRRELVPHIQSLDPPVQKSTLFLDGRWSHAYNLEILESCLLHNIQVVCYPLGHSDKLQPLKKSEFRLVAKLWLDFVAERNNNPLNEFICTSVGDSIFMRNLTASQYKEHITALLRDGFRDVGVLPFRPDLIRQTLPQSAKGLPAPVAEETFLRLMENYCLQIGGEHGLSQAVLQKALEEYKRVLRLGLVMAIQESQQAQAEGQEAVDVQQYDNGLSAGI
ncbi:hypothetical protein BV898_06391 [Hypsibius exemplaris]|uniref:HTH CENPB-type domain-containing protein n=1 Tax=Hypsibius exemplaris TaxID=2072580 RepID=A0A1W0WWP3_HYPEX|nr:hypothetical protein BV898_06391 [Hypsibius exemplaris]